MSFQKMAELCHFSKLVRIIHKILLKTSTYCPLKKKIRLKDCATNRRKTKRRITKCRITKHRMLPMVEKQNVEIQNVESYKR